MSAPLRTAQGWRVYGPDHLERATQVAALRRLGLSLGQIARALAGDPSDLRRTLDAQQRVLRARIGELEQALTHIRSLRADLEAGASLNLSEVAHIAPPALAVTAVFNLPWPWGGERYELRGVSPLNFITGPLGSGKTRFAKCVAEACAGAFIGLERSEVAEADIRAQLAADPALAARIAQAEAWLIDDGASASLALTAVLLALSADGPAVRVVDMVEDSLDEPSQLALIAYLRRREPGATTLFLMTRSSAILDLAATGPDETIFLCPANHAPPIRVEPHRGGVGYEAVATCLASPEVRARTAGVIALRPDAA